MKNKSTVDLYKYTFFHSRHIDIIPGKAQVLLKTLESLLISSVTPVLFLLKQVKRSTMKKSYSMMQSTSTPMSMSTCSAL